MFSKYYKDFLALLFLLGLVLLFFLPIFIFPCIPYSGDFTGSDLTEGIIPFRALFTESIQQGKIPLLNHFSSAGFNLLAEAGTGIFYPLNLLFFGVFSFRWAINLSILSTFFLAAFFIYLYVKEIGISRWGAILAALTFSFSGYFVFGLHHLGKINAAIWLPLELYLIERYFRTKKLILAVFLAIILTVQFFAGFAQVSYYSLISIIIYFIFRYLQQKNSDQAGDIKIFKFWLITSILAFGLSAIQFFPTYEFSKIADRQNWINYETATLYQYHPANLATFIFPYIFGSPANATYQLDIRQFGIFWQNNIYFGLIPFFLAIFTIIFYLRKDWRVKIFLFLLTFSFIFAFGKLTFFYELFWYFLPGIKMFRFPQRILLLTLISFVVLAAIGFDRLVNKIYNFLKVNRYFLKTKNLQYLLPFLFLVLVVADLFIFGIKYNNYLDYQSYFAPPQTVKFLQADKDTFRIWSVGWDKSWQEVYGLSRGWQNKLDLYYNYREIIPPSLNVFWGIDSIEERTMREGGSGGVEWYGQLQVPLLDSVKKENSDKLAISDLVLKLEGMQNVKYLLSFEELQNSNLELIKEISTGFLSPVKIYRNSYFMPRAFGAFKYQTINHREALSYIFKDDFKPNEEIILEKNISYQGGTNGKAEVNMVSYQSEKIEIQINYNQPGLLFVSNVYYPGWQALIDGKESEIYRANYAFQAIKVPAGQHEIKFIYAPLSYRIGKIITLITLVGLIVYLLFLLWKRNFLKI